MTVNPYTHRDVWLRREETFCIEVKRSNSGPDEDGRFWNLWGVYCYIYPAHPLFPKLKPGMRISDPAFYDLKLHGGCTYFQTHRNEVGEICSYQIGCDYNHLHDADFTYMDSKESAGLIFYEADELANQLASMKGE